jgi:hypothetical protein
MTKTYKQLTMDENFYSIGADDGFKACSNCFGVVSFHLYYNSRIAKKWVDSTGKA